jgi:hypothetical protein
MQMIEISVLGILLVLIGVMNKDIEPASIRIPFHDREELLFVEQNDHLHRSTELIQKAPCCVTDNDLLRWTVPAGSASFSTHVFQLPSLPRSPTACGSPFVDAVHVWFVPERTTIVCDPPLRPFRWIAYTSSFV